MQQQMQQQMCSARVRSSHRLSACQDSARDSTRRWSGSRPGLGPRGDSA
jgi:hypothetical protein